MNFVVTLVQTHRNGFSSRTTQYTECQLQMETKQTKSGPEGHKEVTGKVYAHHVVKVNQETSRI